MTTGRRPIRPRTERASAAPILVVCVLLAVVMAAGVGRVGSAVTLRARVDAVADLTALGGVTSGRGGAEEVARRNDAVLVDFELEGETVVVVVERSGARSSAAARAAR